MKTRLILSLVSVLAFAWSAVAQSTAFTYQGRLDNGGNSANGNFDLRFTLHGEAELPGFQVGLPRTNSGVAVSNGLFTTTVDFGPSFDQQPRWIELGVRPAGDTNDFITLAPRQPVNVAPKADFANRAQTLTAPINEGLLPTSAMRRYVNENVTGLYNFAPLLGNPPFTVNSSVLVTNLNADKLNGLESADFWKIGGNAGTTPGTHFFGTTDNQPVEFRVNGVRVLRLEPGSSNSVNVIGGWSGNSVAQGVVGATISGGGSSGFSSVTYPNRVNADYGTISGGLSNTIHASASYATIIGGYANTIMTDSDIATLGGGAFNSIAENSVGAVLGGGWNNKIQYIAENATLGGGAYNEIQNYAVSATLGGGYDNAIRRWSAYATIGGGMANTIESSAREATISGGRWNVIQSGGVAQTIGGGTGNVIGTNSSAATLGGGWGNTISAQAFAATIPGGMENSATNFAFAAGRRAKANHTGTFVWADSTEADFTSTADNQFLIRAAGGVGINTAPPVDFALAVNGTASASKLEISAGSAASPAYAFLGDFNTGLFRPAAGAVSVATAGTERMRINAAGVGIGTTLPQAPLHVWGRAIVNGADQWDVNNTEGDFRVGSATHRFKIGVAQGGGGAGDVWMRAHGGTARLFLKTPGGTTIYSNEGQSSGVSLASGGGAWTTVSDRNAKENFAPVNPQEVLEQVAALPLSSWNYKSQDASIRHVGPMAQDFKAAFGLGESETGITTVDADGVALAAIQGLNAKLESGKQKAETRMEQLEAENVALKARLEQLEQLVMKRLN